MNTTTHAEGPTPIDPARPLSRLLVLYGIALVIVTLAELIGNKIFAIGQLKLVFFPILWALIIGAVVSVVATRRQATWLDRTTQLRCTALVQAVLMLFIGKLGLLVGASIPKLFSQSGAALALQELGHFFGTLALALPLALLLGVKREAIGATFSIGREPSLAIIAEKFGMSSPEGRGVLAEYITGTVIGTLFIGLVAGIIASLHFFDPRALAMGSGVGSGTLMAAASAAIAAQQSPEMAKVVATYAAASNLLTTIVGTYFTLFISLPVAVWLYLKLEPILGQRAKPVVIQDSSAWVVPDLGFGERLAVWVGAGAIALVTGNWITYHTTPAQGFFGMVLVVLTVVIGDVLFNLTKRKMPLVCWVSIVGMLATFPFGAANAAIADISGKVNFLAVGTPILTFAGLSLGKDLPAFQKLGWRIIATSLVANFGTFVFGTLIAQALIH
jgi:hypothetical protein